MALSAAIRSPVSSRVATWMSPVRSPAATRRAAFTAWPSGRTMPRVITAPSRMPSTTPATDSRIMTSRMRSYRSEPSRTDCAVEASFCRASLLMTRSSCSDDAITCRSISAARGSFCTGGSAAAAVKKASASRFHVSSISLKRSSIWRPSSVW